MASSLNFASELGLAVVQLSVGPEKKKFMIHKQLLTSQSLFFRLELNRTGSTLESSISITLDSDDPAAVALMIGFLYRGVVPGWIEIGGVEDTNSSTSQLKTKDNDSNTSPEDSASSEDGTSSRPFVAFVERQPSSRTNMCDYYMNLCFQEFYKDSSQEELRVRDYIRGVRFSMPASNPQHVPGTSSNGLAIPIESSFSTPQPRTPSSLQSNTASAAPLPHNIPGSSVSAGLGTANFRGLSASIFSTQKPASKLPAAPTTINTIFTKTPSNSAVFTSETYSLTLLHLCILAERVSWDSLFNASMKTYVTSIGQLFKSALPIKHVEVIYTHTQAGSGLRDLAINFLSQSGADGFLGFAQENKEFLADMWGEIHGSLGGGRKFSNKSEDGEII